MLESGDTALKNVGNWVLGGATAIMGIAALFVASNVGHGIGYYGGLAMFVFCVAFIMYLLKAGFDHA